MYDAVILDLDGVVTRTANLHSAAWKQMFDHYLKQRAEASGEPFQEFDSDEDYRRYVDGKPRYEGVKSFLSARGIKLPYGHESDPASRETVCGLGNQKNERFLELIEQRGVHVFDDAIERIRSWREAGKKIALVTSSRNGAKIVRKAKLEALFDARVDGVVARELKLPGKPAPDTFLEAARRLGVEPRDATMIEDAVVGVQAGVKGGFGLVVGVARGQNGADLAQAGADVVVSNLRELDIDGTSPRHARRAQRDFADLPDALDSFGKLDAAIAGRNPAFFLDYDGTLTPIVRRPEDAVLSEELRSALQRVARKHSVAIISGRDRADVQRRVGLDELVYAGSHGMDITGPRGLRKVQEAADARLPDIAAAERALRSRLQNVPGVQIERKRFAIAVHFRNVAETYIPSISAAVDEVRSDWPGLRRTGGKKVFELRPDIDWDKGRAVLWILDELNLNRADVLPVYLGDDLTDEDAFHALANVGVTILVGDHGQPTAAAFRLDGPAEVQKLLDRVLSTDPGE